MPLNELSHAYAYSRHPIPSRSRELRACAWRSHTPQRRRGARGEEGRRAPAEWNAACAFTGTKIQVPGVHRGGSTLRPRHVFATPAHRCLGAPLRWGPLYTSSSSSSSSSWCFLIFLPLSLASFFYSFQLIHSFLLFVLLFFLLFPPSSVFFVLFSRSSPSPRSSSPLHLVCIVLFSLLLLPPLLLLLVVVVVLPRQAYTYTRGINSRTPRKNRGNVITTLSFARSCSADPRARRKPWLVRRRRRRAPLPRAIPPSSRRDIYRDIFRWIVTSGGIAAETIDSRTPFTILIAKRIVRDGGRGWEETDGRLAVGLIVIDNRCSLKRLIYHWFSIF